MDTHTQVSHFHVKRVKNKFEKQDAIFMDTMVSRNIDCTKIQNFSYWTLMVL